MFTEEAIISLVGALRSLPPRDAAEEPETLEVLRAAVRKRLAATGICVKRHASDAQFGEQPSQRK